MKTIYNLKNPATVPIFQQKWIQEVENYVLQNLKNSNLIIVDIANNLGISERQLYRRIKKVLGITPNIFIRQIKMKAAKEYLERGEFSTVAEVSFAVGYNRPDYFSNEFEKIYKKRPIEYFSAFNKNVIKLSSFDKQRSYQM